MKTGLLKNRLNLARCSLLLAAVLLLLIPAEPLLSQSQNSQSAIETAGESPVKIGLLITADTSENVQARQAVHVVEWMLNRVNAGGGVRGKPVEAVVKSVDGNWGSGSKQSVNLIYEEGVSALLGFLDGRSAHLVEQVCTKAEVPFVSTFSPDPTLSRINIPWYFSTMPTAAHQAAALAEEIFERQQNKRIAVISTDDYDMRFLADSFLHEIERRSYPVTDLATYRTAGASIHDIASAIREKETEAIVFLGNSKQWSELVLQLSALKLNLPLFLPVMDWAEDTDSLPAPFPVYAVTPGSETSDEGSIFREEFTNRYGYRPGMTAYYVYDGAKALLNAIESRGEGRIEIKQGLSELGFTGLSGRISFDDTGEIKYKPAVSRIKGPEIK